MIKLHPKYKPIAQSDSRYFVVTGGRGSGKSFAVNLLLCLLSLERGHKILFTRYTMTAAKISIIPEFLEKIELLDMADYFTVTNDSIRNKLSGSEIIFKGIKTSSGDQTAALKSLQGITTWVLDEAEELTDEETFDKIDLSVRQKGIHNRVILIMNPATKAHWIYGRFFEAMGVQEGTNGAKQDTTYIHTTYLDNKSHLDQSFINQVERIKKTRPEKYKHQILGGWLNKAEGVIFTNWQLGEYPDAESVYGMDFGFSVDPTTLIATYIDKPKGQIYLKEYLYKPNLTTSDIYNAVRETVGKSLVVADSAEPRLISELKSRGLNIVPAVKGQGSVNAGIAMLQDYKLIIDPDSSNLIKELNNYSWLENKVVPIDSWNHAIDSVRYSTYYQLEKPNRGVYNVK